jgi:hypothetical protein
MSPFAVRVTAGRQNRFRGTLVMNVEQPCAGTELPADEQRDSSNLSKLDKLHIPCRRINACNLTLFLMEDNFQMQFESGSDTAVSIILCS